MQQQAIHYHADGTDFIGQCFFTPSEQAAATVMVFPAFEGLNDNTFAYAKKLAQLGYTACAMDVYGAAQVKQTLAGCMESLQPLLADRAALLRRLTAAYQAVIALPQVDANRVASMGFCFGGLCGLDLARSGANLAGVISLHGNFSQPENVAAAAITAKILILHGHDDPLTPPEQLLAFSQEMNNAGVDWQAHFFSHTKHAYTDPQADQIGPPSMGREYNELSSARSWQLSKTFLAEVLNS